MSDEHRFRRALIQLNAEALRLYANASSNRNIAACLALLSRTPTHKAIPARKLHNTLFSGPDRYDTHLLGGMVALPVPSHRRFVPLLSAFWDFAKPYPEVRLQVVLFRSDCRTLYATGYRFETPEGGPNHEHAFFHAQPISQVVNHAPGVGAQIRTPIQIARPVFNDKDPSFPLDAADYVDLLLCVLVALYGRKGGRDQAQVGLGTRTTDARLRTMRTMNS